VPQNFANGFSVGDDDCSRVRLTVEVPPISASQPVANWERSWCELRLNRVIGLRFGSLAPSMRATCAPYQIFVTVCSKLEANVLFVALVRKTWADLPR